MTPDQESAYLRGERDVWLVLLRLAVQHLGPDVPETDDARWRIEREEAIAMLRQACEAAGDNDWTEDLHLADIVDKHLLRHLEAK